MKSRTDYQLFKEFRKMHLPGTLLYTNKRKNFLILQGFPRSTSVWILRILRYTLRREQDNSLRDTTIQTDKRWSDMKIVKFILKVWSQFGRLNQGLPTDIDSHKWAYKMEIYRLLSSKPY